MTDRYDLNVRPTSETSQSIVPYVDLWSTQSWQTTGSTLGVYSVGPSQTTTGTMLVLCPDLLRLEQIGVADNLRGRIVRAFFAILDRVMPVRS